MSRTTGERTRAAIVDEAIRAFATHGFEGATLDDIAAAAGVRKQSLLYHFPSKKELLNAAVEGFAQQVALVLEEALDTDAQGWERVEHVIRALFRMAERTPQLPAFAREAARVSPEIVQKVAGSLEPLRKRALIFLEKGMQEGEFRTQDPGLLLFTLYTAIVGSLTEAGVLRAVAGRAIGKKALEAREEELVIFVRRALTQQ